MPRMMVGIDTDSLAVPDVLIAALAKAGLAVIPAGTAGQMLTTGADGLVWADPPAMSYTDNGDTITISGPAGGDTVTV